MNDPGGVRVNIGGTTLTLVQGDITRETTDAIVNAANPGLLGGGGVDGAIHRAGGPEILAQCREIRIQQGDCPPGKAVITGAGKLKAGYVIHTVGPVWRGGKNKEDDLLADAYRNSLELAVRRRLSTISFPSISTGAYGFPIERASRIAVQTVSDFVRRNPGLKEVHFVVFSRSDYDVYNATMNASSP